MQKIDAQLTKYNIKYERFSAVQGCSVKNSPLLTEYCNSFCTDGQKGCAISHKTLWNDMIENRYESILILEDDAILADDFDTKLKNAWYQVPSDYDLVFLGCRVFCNTEDLLPVTITKVTGSEPVLIDEKVQEVKGMMGTHGYILRANVAKIFKDIKINWHIDNQLSNQIVPYNLNVYSIKPILIDVIDNAGGSNISDTYPPLLNSLLNVTIFEQTTLSWFLGEQFIRIGPFNLNATLSILFVLTFLLPTYTYKYIFLWILAEFIASRDVHNTTKYIAFLSIPMVLRHMITPYIAPFLVRFFKK
jgi:GR25 family glycosyltransferase involved in LPS biosynthesis